MSLLIFSVLIGGYSGSAFSIARYISRQTLADVREDSINRLFRELDRAVRGASSFPSLPLFLLNEDSTQSCVLRLHETSLTEIFRVISPRPRLMRPDSVATSLILEPLVSDESGARAARSFDRALGVGVDGAAFLEVQKLRRSGTAFQANVRRLRDPIAEALEHKLVPQTSAQLPLSAIGMVLPILTTVEFDLHKSTLRRSVIGKKTAQTLASGIAAFSCSLEPTHVSGARRLRITINETSKTGLDEPLPGAAHRFEWILSDGTGHHPVDLLGGSE